MSIEPTRALDTPVVLLMFNRPAETVRVLDAVRQVRPKRLFVVADGPRGHVPDDAARCARARALIETVDWPCRVETNYADHNLGCRARVASGLDWVFDRAEEAMVLEDDCLPDPSCTTLLRRICQQPGYLCLWDPRKWSGFQGRRSHLQTIQSFRVLSRVPDSTARSFPGRLTRIERQGWFRPRGVLLLQTPRPRPG